jgi:predicted O-linked N-acetylglucosamine transferase (SPINDLY family)
MDTMAQNNGKASQVSFEHAFTAYRSGQLAQALSLCDEAIRFSPKNAEALHLAGVILAGSGNAAEAISYFEKAVRLQPGNGEARKNLGFAYYHLGLAMLKAGKPKEALAAFKRALGMIPDYPPALAEVCRLIYHQSSLKESKHYFERMLAIHYSPGLYVTSRLLLPSILPSTEAIDKIRAEHEANIDALLKENIVVEEPYRELLRTSFYLAYHARNNKALMQKLVRLYYHLCPALSFTAPHCQQRQERGSKIRVGFVSKYFHYHSVSLCFNELIRSLAGMEDFEVFMLCTDQSPKKDAMFTALESVCSSSLVVPPNIGEAQKAVAALKLDILVFTELGMDGLAYYLAFARLAPVQVLFGGHPDTSGIPTVDYVLSSRLLEPVDAAQHHSEQVKLLEGIAVTIPRTTIGEKKGRRELGLPEGKTIYLCPMKLQKIHPEFDTILRGILEGDEEGYIVLFKDHQTDWHELVMERFRQSIGKKSYLARILFLPFVAPEIFPNYLTQADVVLDTIHFSGGTTSYMVLGLGAPIVTLPGEFSRGRATYSCYKAMGMEDLVAKDAEDYIRLALRLGKDETFNRQMRETIVQRCGVLFERKDTAGEVAHALRQML